MNLRILKGSAVNLGLRYQKGSGPPIVYFDMVSGATSWASNKRAVIALSISEV